MNETTIAVHLDASANRAPFTDKTISLTLDKGELFKYAIYILPVPPYLKESDFEWLQSKVPFLEGLYEAYIELTATAIVNSCDDDTVKQNISEAVGIGVGLKYTTLLLDINPNKFKKIGVPTAGKYLDYGVTENEKAYEIETKGTIGDYYSTMKNDIVAKKTAQQKVNPKVYLRFGTIAMLTRDKLTGQSKCVVVDDPPQETEKVEEDFYDTQLNYYAIYLSFILDSKYYNRYIRPLIRKNLNRVKISANKFFGKYVFEGKTYFGECFDYRLIRENVEVVKTYQAPDAETAFRMITDRVGRVKFFVGMELPLINAVNKGDRLFLLQYRSKKVFAAIEGGYKSLDQDGILIIKSENASDNQLERIFTEEEVKERLNLYDRYIRGEAHLCGAPCTSRGIEGKPCEKHTYRKHCFFHR